MQEDSHVEQETRGAVSKELYRVRKNREAARVRFFCPVSSLHRVYLSLLQFILLRLFLSLPYVDHPRVQKLSPLRSGERKISPNNIFLLVFVLRNSKLKRET